MKRVFIKCESCNADIPSEPCEFATYRTVINGKEHVFCCQQCAQRYSEKRSGERQSKKG